MPFPISTHWIQGNAFPLKLYDKTEAGRDDDLFVDQDNTLYRVRDGISDEALTHFQARIPGKPSAKKIYSITCMGSCIQKITVLSIAII